MKRTLIACALGLAACVGNQPAEGQWAAPMAEATFPDKTLVRLEVADSEEERTRGLMFRKELAATEGMIFVFEEPGFYPFWMRNCLIALDLLWLDAGGTVLSIAPSLPPCRLAGCNPPCDSYECPTYPPDPGTIASYVVEVQSGFAKTHNLRKGDRLVLKGLPATR
jgi:uncharacterized membrane protein (UPF0127 family)